jgi:hypothetical protein
MAYFYHYFNVYLFYKLLVNKLLYRFLGEPPLAAAQLRAVALSAPAPPSQAPHGAPRSAWRPLRRTMVRLRSRAYTSAISTKQPKKEDKKNDLPR